MHLKVCRVSLVRKGKAIAQSGPGKQRCNNGAALAEGWADAWGNKVSNPIEVYGNHTFWMPYFKEWREEILHPQHFIIENYYVSQANRSP